MHFNLTQQNVHGQDESIWEETVKNWISFKIFSILNMLSWNAKRKPYF